MDEGRTAGRSALPVVVRRDTEDFKGVEITVGDEQWSVDIARRIVDDGPALWAWDYTVSHAVVGTGVHAAQWPTWERALEEALAYITRNRSEAHNV